MRITVPRLSVMAAGIMMAASSFAMNVTWYQSGFNPADGGLNRWVKKTSPSTKEWDHTDYRLLELDPNATLQTISGFGGAFNEKGWDAMSALQEGSRQQIVRDLFSRDGLDLGIARIPIGANDYSMDYYSLDDTPGDYALKDFSLARDKKYLIPYVKAALAYKPELTIFASPWTPPAWMKANHHYACKGSEDKAHLVFDDKTQTAYAGYLSKFVSAYRDEGITIAQVHVQNEPAACQNFPSSVWTGAQLHDFLKGYLIPRFENDGQRASLWFGTVNHGDYMAYAQQTLDDPALQGKIGGVGYQWDGKYAIADTHARHPEIQLMQTESECGNGSNDVAAGFYTFSLMKKYFEGGANAYVYWNMVLDGTGNSTWGWRQNSLVSVDRDKGTVQYNFEYYVMKHFSSLVKPGAHLLRLAFNEDALAFENPDRSIVVVAANPSYSDRVLTIKLGAQMVKVTVPTQTINSFVVKP